MGADVEGRDGRLPPLRVRGAPLRGIDYEMPVASAQVKSCVLLAGLLAEGDHDGPRALLDARPHRAAPGLGRAPRSGGTASTITDRPDRAPRGRRRAGAG